MEKVMYKNLPLDETFKLTDYEFDKRIYKKYENGAREIVDIFGVKNDLSTRYITIYDDFMCVPISYN